MPPVISFIGWHNSGKTTLARQVVALLKAKGYAVGVVKSTKETGIDMDRPPTDTALYRLAGADAVALAAPDQFLLRAQPVGSALRVVVQTHFSSMDIVIAEGFKAAEDIPKIEVRREPAAPVLHRRVAGVIAVAADHELPGIRCFGLDQAAQIAAFIETRFLFEPQAVPGEQALYLEGRELLQLTPATEARLAAFVRSLEDDLRCRDRTFPGELTIRCRTDPSGASTAPGRRAGSAT